MIRFFLANNPDAYVEIPLLLLIDEELIEEAIVEGFFETCVVGSVSFSKQTL